MVASLAEPLLDAAGERRKTGNRERREQSPIFPPVFSPEPHAFPARRIARETPIATLQLATLPVNPRVRNA
jgi:hypothetical protein